MRAARSRRFSGDGVITSFYNQRSGEEERPIAGWIFSPFPT
jgi:hypothetical protein